MSPCRLVFTDLDGTLLDHDTYSFSAALPTLTRLADLEIPVIPVTSKTRAEIEALRESLDNAHPFIVENGAAVFIPEGYFADVPAGTVPVDGYHVYSASPPREHWLALLDTLAPAFPGEFTSFARAGVDGIAELTGLSIEAAGLANRREYSEPVKWLGSASRKAEFVDRLRAAGANPLQGGRFLSVSGDCDKGRALRWVRGVYSRYAAAAVVDIAAGDSDNDIAMLEAARTALLIRSASHPFPALARASGLMYSEHCGPEGWAEGIDAWLDATAGQG